MPENEYTLVEYFGKSDGSECGYCHGLIDGKRSTHGMWAHYMTTAVYQSLIDRGWRRSGKYCYKPVMNETCCPQYTIKCDVTVNQLTKGQKKCLKRFHNYIQNDVKPKTLSNEHNSLEHAQTRSLVKAAETPKQKPNQTNNVQIKDRSRKKRFQRYQRQVEKLRSRNLTDLQIEEHFKKRIEFKLQKQKPKAIEDYFAFTSSAKNKLEVKLVSSADASVFDSAQRKNEFTVYKKYQTTIHKDEEDKITEKQFQRFLIDSPLKYSEFDQEVSGGSFHQQYWLNGELIAVGVIDILDLCVSSVYFFYDPSYNFLSLGRISAFQEIMFTRKLHSSLVNLKYYYMGFYIHSCPKMKYKGEYSGSFLLCPEAYSWHPIEEVSHLLDVQRYTRFAAEGAPKAPPGSLKDLLVLFDQTAMTYIQYRQKTGSNKDEDKEVLDICQLIGKRATEFDFVLYRG
ncbi:arginyl-tRNA--protein transferase 1-like [Symsagittifera roscoffensis]|uniref:arginyl-tRNA--protein transferase 1-like n=1 Tax=Symsagittifera roscoffensis TaxID=84072 RepID=UPI00307B109E